MIISELAERAGIATSAIRYYERAHLLPKAKRGSNGYRTYDDSALERIYFIQIGQKLSFTLESIREVIAFEGQALRLELMNSFDVRLKDIDHMLQTLGEQRSALLKTREEMQATWSEQVLASACVAKQKAAVSGK